LPDQPDSLPEPLFAVDHGDPARRRPRRRGSLALASVSLVTSLVSAGPRFPPAETPNAGPTASRLKVSCFCACAGRAAASGRPPSARRNPTSHCAGRLYQWCAAVTVCHYDPFRGQERSAEARVLASQSPSHPVPGLLLLPRCSGGPLAEMRLMDGAAMLLGVTPAVYHCTTPRTRRPWLCSSAY
jgi:hypothetical protein